MSVISRMLSDLDTRGVRGTAHKATDAGIGAARAKPAAWRLPVIALAGAGAVAAALYVPVPAPATTATSEAVPLAAAVPMGPAASDAQPAEVATSEIGASAAASSAPQRAARARAAGPAPASAVPPVAPVAPVPATPAAGIQSAAAVVTLPPGLAQAPMAVPARIEKRPVAQSAEQRAQVLYNQAVTQAQMGQRVAARQLLDQVLELQITHGAARHLGAVLDYESGHTDRAVASLQEGLTLPTSTGTDHAAQALLLARLQVAQGHLEAGLSTLQTHRLRGAEADGLRAGIHAQLGQHKAAGEAYARAAGAQPANPMWWFGLGVALESDGQPQGAKQAYAQARALGLPREDLASYAEQRLRSLP